MKVVVVSGVALVTDEAVEGLSVSVDGQDVPVVPLTVTKVATGVVSLLSAEGFREKKIGVIKFVREAGGLAGVSVGLAEAKVAVEAAFLTKYGYRDSGGVNG